MARGFYVNGETLVTTSFGELGLADGPMNVRPRLHHLDIRVGNMGEAIANQQMMGADITVDMILVHFDPAILSACIAASMASATEGTLVSAGTLMGQDANGNGSQHYFSVTLSSPVAANPWVVTNAYMPDTPVVYPLGAERSLAQVTFRGIAYTADPKSAAGISVWHH